MRDSNDPEFLHQMRVSIRAARAVARPLCGVYEEPALERLASELVWVARISGPPRDLDVFFERLPDYSRTLPPQVREDLEPFRRLLESHRKRALTELRQELSTKRFGSLMREWKRVADEAGKRVRKPRRSAKRFARQWTWTRYRRTRRRLLALHDDSAPADIHRARIELKKLRYLIECFRSLFPEKSVERVVGPLKIAQDTLGSLNDLVVHRSMIRGLARSAATMRELPTDTLIAMGELSAALESERRSLILELGRQLKALSNKAFRKRFRALYRP